jgi:3-hydroxyacyl-[acyl-carrier-protein] dehydratase
VPGGRIVTACRVPEQSPVFEGHFPGYPIMPGVLLIETMAQTGGWLILATGSCSRMPFLMQVEKAKMRAFVTPGQALEVAANLLHQGSGYAVLKASILVDGKKVTEAEIRYGVVPFPNETLKAAMLQTARRIGLPSNFMSPDSMSPDSMSPDSMSPDSMSPDSMSPDSMSPDSMSPDSGPPDAEPRGPT